MLETNSENTVREFRDYVERKAKEVGRACEMRNVAVLQKVGQVVEKCAKQSGLEKLSLDVAQLKRNEKRTARKSLYRPQHERTTLIHRHHG